MPTVLVTRRLPSAVVAKLEAAADVHVYAGDGTMPREQLLKQLVEADGLVCMLTDQINREAIDAAPQLKVVANVAVGYNNIDVGYALSHGIVVTNTPDVLTESVADFTWAMILAVTRRLAEGDRLIRRSGWKGWAFDFMLGSELRGKQLGLVGMGRIACAVGARAPAFGVRVAYTSRHPRALIGSTEMSLDQLLNTSDVISLHVPLTDDTNHLIDKRAFTRMKRSAYLVNTCRGPVVDEAALVWALEQRLIAGAALDVYEHEPHIHSGLLALENVLLVPHLGSGTSETRTAMADLAVENVVSVLSGQPPPSPVAW